MIFIFDTIYNDPAEHMFMRNAIRGYRKRDACRYKKIIIEKITDIFQSYFTFILDIEKRKLDPDF